jgi:hypothetical protein
MQALVHVAKLHFKTTESKYAAVIDAKRSARNTLALHLKRVEEVSNFAAACRI